MMRHIASMLLWVPLIANAAWFGPSGSDNDCTSRASFAWCIMDLAKKSEGIDDAKPGTMPVGYSAPGVVSKTVDGIGIASQAAIGVGDLTKISNVSLLGGFGGAMNLLSAVRDLGRTDPASNVHTVAVLPEGETNPYSTVASSITDAIKQLTGATNIEYSSEPYAHLGISKRYGHIKLTGGGMCATHECVAVITINKDFCRSEKANVPAWLNESKQATILRCGNGFFLTIDGKLVDRDIATYGLMKYMPDSVFIYLPPSKVKPIATVVTKDKEFFFVRPETKE